MSRIPLLTSLVVLMLSTISCGVPVETEPGMRPEAEEVAVLQERLGGEVDLVLTGSVAANAWSDHNPIAVASGTRLIVQMSGVGDPDLYVRFGAQAQTNQFDCRPYLGGASETCTLTVPVAQSKAFISTWGYAASPSYTLNVRYTPPGGGVVAQNFDFYVVRSIVLARDGGSIHVDGYVNRSTDAFVRYDGAFGSPTRGQIFVTVTRFGSAADPERAMTTNERGQLKRNLQKIVAPDPATAALIALL